MNRRSFLATLVVAGASLSMWPAFAGLGRPSDPVARLVGTLRHRRSADAVGRAFLEQHPDEADRGRLATTLCDDLHRCGCDPARTGKKQLRARISERVRSDFADSRVVNVRGWILSTTEARLCGLAALSA